MDKSFMMADVSSLNC